ncbi:hypothetical protein [Cellulomonas biazotea]|uniref:Uncharacterized protein n=1 Tax=Cellulomonas biazotea TaxID=1709 RepID=A0A402DME2_9CELL|nr:hypothetical protein [Cellulomonas biazotea]GCE75286.1 hypothetical protein CBZ_03420 [Cellulomonas biazotea]
MGQSRTHRPQGGTLDGDRADTGHAGATRGRTDHVVAGPVEAARRAVSRHSVTALQRLAGNRAVSDLLGQDLTPATPVTPGRSPAFGATTAAAPSSTPFGRSPQPARRSGAEVQRFSTTDSTVANVASVFGAAAGTGAASMMGAVTFDSSAFSAAIAKPLAITRTGTDLTVGSQTYSASGTVKASGPKARVGGYEIGFLQTVYASSRNFYYEPTGHAPGFLAQLAPSIFGTRKVVSDTCTTLPVRDGDAGKRPWYGMETVDQFAAADPSTKTSAMDDTPDSTQPWSLGTGANQQNLVRTDGKDQFRSWLAVKDTSSTSAILLNYADWEVDYGTAVTFNAASPGASVVTPTATSGGKVTATGDGSGGKTPLHGDPVANDVATIQDGNW